MNSVGGHRGSQSRSSSSSGGATDDVFVGVATVKSATLRAEGTSLKSACSIREDAYSGGGGEERNNPHGQLGWLVTGLIIVGDLAGGGIVALPMAIVQTGMIVGMISLVATTLLSTFTAYLIGRTWSLLREAWPEEYKEMHTRKPYAEIGMRAVGSRMRTFVSLNINLTQFGISVVYFLLSSKNIQNIVKAFFDADIPYCIIIFALAIFMLPITFLKSPNDFWWAIVIAMITTTIAVVLVITGAMLDYDACEESHSMPPFRVGNFLLGLGTLLFSYGGHAAFPTIQHDMRRPEDFTKSAVFAFGVTFLLYAPIAIAGVVAYGDSIRDAIISSVQIIGLQQAVNILITAHLILALAIIINPVNQEAEQLFHTPHHFCWQRVLVRTVVLFTVAFVGATVPSFGPLLNLVGGSTMTFAAVCFPCVFYLAVHARCRILSESDGKDDRVPSVNEIIQHNSSWMLLTCGALILFGLICGAAATFAAIRDVSSAHFEPPCYVTMLRQKAETSTAVSHTNCCGAFQNITTRAGVVCTAPDLTFYTR